MTIPKPENAPHLKKTLKHTKCLDYLRKEGVDETDVRNVGRMGPKVFKEHYEHGFANFVARDKQTLVVLRRFLQIMKAEDDRIRQSMLAVTLATKRCGRCGSPHGGLRVRIDGRVPYTLCTKNGQRLNVVLDGANLSGMAALQSLLFSTVFVVEDKSDPDAVKELRGML